MHIDKKTHESEIENELQDQMIHETEEFVELYKLFEPAINEINRCTYKKAENMCGYHNKNRY